MEMYDYLSDGEVVEVEYVSKPCINTLNPERFIGLYREVSKDLYRLIDVGIRGYENAYMKEGDIPAIITEDMRFGDELVLSESIRGE